LYDGAGETDCVRGGVGGCGVGGVGGVGTGTTVGLGGRVDAFGGVEVDDCGVGVEGLEEWLIAFMSITLSASGTPSNHVSMRAASRTSPHGWQQLSQLG